MLNALGETEYTATAPFALKWHVAAITAPICLLLAIVVYQNVFYARVGAGGVSLDEEGRFKWVGYVALGYETLQGMYFATQDPNNGFLAMVGILVVAGFLAILMDSGPRAVSLVPSKEKPKKGKSDVAKELEEVQKDIPQQIAVRTINGTPVPSDILSPGRKRVVNSPFFRVGIQIKEFAGIMDIDTESKTVKSSVEPYEMLKLHLEVVVEWPDNPLHLCDAFKIPGLQMATDVFKGRTDMAAMHELDRAKYDDLKQRVYSFPAAYYDLFGRTLSPDEIDDLKSGKASVYDSVSCLNITKAYFYVTGTEAQEKLWEKQAQEGVERSSEIEDAKTTKLLIKEYKDMGYSLEEAKELAVVAQGHVKKLIVEQKGGGSNPVIVNPGT